MSRSSKKYELNDTLPFGKYAGKAINEILKEDYTYVRWLIKNSIILFEENTLTSCRLSIIESILDDKITYDGNYPEYSYGDLDFN